jgi:hypothetical protein
VKVELRGETAKAYRIRVEDDERAVEAFIPKSQARLATDGIYVKGWLFAKDVDIGLAGLLLGDLLKKVSE